MPGSRFRKDQGGVSSVVAFLLAGIVFISAIGAVLWTGSAQGDTSDDDLRAAGLKNRATSLSSVLLDSPGVGSGGIDWLEDPDSLQRLGLRDADDLGSLDWGKFNNLAAAPLLEDLDGLVNYPEARRSLGLDGAGLDFHIRAFPALEDVRTLLATGHRDPNLRVAYVGHQDVKSSSGGGIADGLEVTFPDPCTTDGDDEWHLNAELTNGGTAATQFSVTFHAVLDGVAVDQSSNTFEVPSGASTTVTLEVPWNGTGASCTAGSTIEVEVWDPSTKLLEVGTTLAGSVTPPPNVSPRLLYANPAKGSFGDTEDVVIAYDGQLEKGDALTLYIYADPVVSGSHIYTATTTVPSSQNKWRFDDIPHTVFDGHGTDFWAYVDDGDTLVGDRFLVRSPAPGDFAPASGGTLTYSWSEAVPIEAGIVADLIERFCPFEFDSTTASPTGETSWTDRCSGFQEAPQPGDIFPDNKHVANSELVARLWDDVADAPRYDETNTLIVGSNVEHNSMTSNAIKDAIGEWVLGGGTLIVFGHDEKNVQWLQSIFHAGIESSSGGIAVPDAQHPVLRVADPLAPSDYDNHGKAWKFQHKTDELFTHIVVEDGEPVLTISNPGALGSGTVILTSWLPYDLFGSGPDADDFDAYAVINNFLMQGYRDLFLDYGPPIPTASSAIPASRAATIEHPELGILELTIQVWVFEGA